MSFAFTTAFTPCNQSSGCPHVRSPDLRASSLAPLPPRGAAPRHPSGGRARGGGAPGGARAEAAALELLARGAPPVRGAEARGGRGGRGETSPRRGVWGAGSPRAKARARDVSL